MSFVHGKNTDVWLDGYDISEYLNAADLSVDVDTADTTTFKQDWKTAVAGEAASTVELAGLYDTTYQDAHTALNAQAGSVLTVCPGTGASVGATARLAKVLKTAYKESSPVGDVVAFSLGVTADGEVGFGHVISPLNTFDTDTNGTSYDGGAATTTGAIAHLHVVEVSAGDSIDVTIEDSADDSSWATIGTFATKSAVGAERLVIAGTVRRYVRAVFNVTGSDVAISAAVAFART